MKHVLFLAALGFGPCCAAQTAPPADATEDSLAHWQTTYVWQRKAAFPAAGDPPMSLVSRREPRSYTLTATGYLGKRLAEGTEIYYNPEMSMSQSLSELAGLGGLSNGENQKGGGPNPIFYNARLFARHTWNLGGESEPVESALNQMAGAADKQRVVLTAGKLAVTDLFDANRYNHDPRSQFLNWSLMTHGAYDYAADSRGYSIGAALEYYRDGWEFRAGRFMMPIESNGLLLDTNLFKHYGDQAEVSHNHRIGDLEGAIRLLAFRNRAIMGGFRDAVAAAPGAADLNRVRRDRTKTGLAVNAEQQLNQDIGIFARASGNDGDSETYAYAEIERSASAGISVKGRAWQRAEDTFAVAAVENGLSAAHRAFLANAGQGVFLGGWAQTRYWPERIVESYYSFALSKGATFSLDYQHISNPGYNPDRGPVAIYGARLHYEY
ncbi:MAG TPA: carbohydrate porin [Rhodocyclaceae bacterium]